MSRLASLPLALLVALMLASAQAISYTVQVVAVSEQESALSVQRTLLNEAFPAYVVRATTAQGDIYRVRVGAFGNRAAAQAFAESMSIVAGSTPLPALAEGIPQGVMPLEPRVLLDLTGAEADVLPWEGGVAVRLQGTEGEPATFHVFTGGEQWSFEAWSAAPTEGGVARVRPMPLWPSTWEDDTPEAREAYRVALLDSLAARLNLRRDDLERFQARPPFGPPFLMLLELAESPSANATPLGVAEPDESGTTPLGLAVGTGPLPQTPEPLYRASHESEPSAAEFAGENWSVIPDGQFFLLRTDEAGRGWRAGVGTPLWSDGVYVLTRRGETLLFYDFLPR